MMLLAIKIDKDMNEGFDRFNNEDCRNQSGKNLVGKASEVALEKARICQRENKQQQRSPEPDSTLSG